MAIKIATSEIPDNIKSGRVQFGKADVVVRVISFFSEKRSVAAKKTAKTRRLL